MNFGKIKQLAKSIIETEYHLDKEKKKKKELMEYMHQLSLNIDSELE